MACSSSDMKMATESDEIADSGFVYDTGMMNDDAAEAVKFIVSTAPTNTISAPASAPLIVTVALSAAPVTPVAL